MKKILLISGFAVLTLSFAVSRYVVAGDKPPADKGLVVSACDTDAASYLHGALTNFHNQLCHINVHFPAIAEEVLYKLIVIMGMNPDLTTLAADGTATALTSATVDSKVITGTVQKVVAPSTFATFYDYKAEVKIDGVTYVTFYWTGSGASSKGFLTLGGPGFGSGTALLYIRWDRTSAAQEVDVMGARLATSYLGSPTTDDAIYGRVTYDTGTKDTTVQVVEIGRQRGGSPSTTVFACWKMYATGVSGGAMRVGKTQDALSSSTGHAISSVTQDGIDEMDDWEGNDTKTEPNGTGNGTSVQGFAMNYSCADLANAASASGPFDANTVNHNMTKTEMDTMFSAN